MSDRVPFPVPVSARVPVPVSVPVRVPVSVPVPLRGRLGDVTALPPPGAGLAAVPAGPGS